MAPSLSCAPSLQSTVWSMTKNIFGIDVTVIGFGLYPNGVSELRSLQILRVKVNLVPPEQLLELSQRVKLLVMLLLSSDVLGNVRVQIR